MAARRRVSWKVFQRGASARASAPPAARSRTAREPVGQGVCWAVLGYSAAVRRSQASGETCGLENGTLPGRERAGAESCCKMCVGAVRKSAQKLMQGHSGTRCTRQPPAGARTSDSRTTPWHSDRAHTRSRGRRPDLRTLAQYPQHSDRPRTRCTDAGPTSRLLHKPQAGRSIRAPAPPAHEPLHTRSTTPATAQPGRPLRRRPSRCVETMCEQRGCCDVCRAAHLGQRRSLIAWRSSAPIYVKNLGEGRECLCSRRCAGMGTAVTFTATANRRRSCSCWRRRFVALVYAAGCTQDLR